MNSASDTVVNINNYLSIEDNIEDEQKQEHDQDDTITPKIIEEDEEKWKEDIAAAKKETRREVNELNYKLKKTVCKGMIKQYKYRRAYEDIITTLYEAFEKDKIAKRNLIEYLLQEEEEEMRSIRISIRYRIQFKKLDADGELANLTKLTIRDPMKRISNIDDLEEIEQDVFTHLEQRINNFVQNDSGWIVNEVLYSEILVKKFCY